MWVELVAETTPTKRDSGDSCRNPPVTQVAKPLIKRMSYKTNSPPSQLSWRAKLAIQIKIFFLHQAVNMFFLM